jgi:hypothetical protein
MRLDSQPGRAYIGANVGSTAGAAEGRQQARSQEAQMTNREALVRRELAPMSDEEWQAFWAALSKDEQRELVFMALEDRQRADR